MKKNYLYHSSDHHNLHNNEYGGNGIITNGKIGKTLSTKQETMTMVSKTFLNGFDFYETATKTTKNSMISTKISNRRLHNNINRNNDNNDDMLKNHLSNGIKSNGFIQNYYRNCLPMDEEHCSELLSSKNNVTANHHNENHQRKSHFKLSLNKSLLNHPHEDSIKIKSTPDSRYNRYEEAPYHIGFLCYVSYAVLIIFGYIRDFMRKAGFEKNLAAVERDREGYTPLYKSFECFYTRNIYRRIRDAWNRPITSVPGAEIDVIDRISSDQNWTFQFPGTKTRVINMGSYNYLGFAENSGPIHEKVIKIIQEYGVGICSTRNEFGLNEHVQHLEHLMSRFLGVESCIVFGMGFATNSTNIQCFVNKGCLILSDEHNHASLILGCRLSGAVTKVFKHNNMKDLERKICRYIQEGQPKTHEPWKKIIIVVEGIYSMEGTIVNLPELIRIKKKYKCYIYLDEAHSIGALGPNAGGVIDYYGCDPNDVDILMGTFTKSFGAAGGYVAGRQNLVDLIRINSFSHYYANPMSPPLAKQIICVVQSLLGEDGTDDGAKRIRRLAYNSRYFRKKLRQMGFIVYGHDDSPVVPLLLCFCAKIAAVIRMAHEKGLGFIGAGYPATALTSGRVRFCVSAAHTKEMLDRALKVMNEIGDKINIKYSSQPVESQSIFDDDDDDDDYYY